ncbi:MAG TPA: hypothetical protein VMJ90_00150 [Anaerolineales bacterium]|nr:hypothetical protein [Anaerolineales bacterium]
MEYLDTKSSCVCRTDANHGATLSVQALAREIIVPRRSSGLGCRVINPLFSSRSSIAVVAPELKPV